MQFWQQGYVFPHIERAVDPLKLSCAAQSDLGWDKFWLEILSLEWAKYQRQYWTNRGTDWCTIHWTSRVIRLVWEIAWDLWLR